MHDYSRLGRLVCVVSIVFIAAGLFGCATTQSTPSTGAATQAEKAAASGQVQRPVYTGPVMAPYYRPPDRIDLCGEPVPLEFQEVFERFDKEFTLIVYNHAQVYRWLKSRGRSFPYFEERLRRLNLPEDLKYLALAESEPLPTALALRKPAEKRYDFSNSADSAFAYLGDLYRSFRNWPLALAAFHLGEKRMMEEVRAQGVTDYYHMRLPEDTERYVFRILAIKAVLTDPARYGYETPRSAGRPQP